MIFALFTLEENTMSSCFFWFMTMCGLTVRFMSWKLLISITNSVPCFACSRKSSVGMPMFPTRCTSLLSSSRMAVIRLAVVLFPLVPVTPITCEPASWTLSRKSCVVLVSVSFTAFSSGRGGMPGDLMMTSNFSRFRSHPVPSCCQYFPSSTVTLSFLSAMVISHPGAYFWSARAADWPSRPYPRMQTALPASSRMCIEAHEEAGAHGVLAAWFEHTANEFRNVCDALCLLEQEHLHHRRLLQLALLHGEEHGCSGLLRRAHALERFESGEAEQLPVERQQA